MNPTEEEVAALYEQVQLRIAEGQGEAFFDIGLGDGSGSGLTEEELTLSLATLEQIAGRCNADLTMLRKKVWDTGLVAECLVRCRMGPVDFMEIRCVCCVSVYGMSYFGLYDSVLLAIP